MHKSFGTYLAILTQAACLLAVCSCKKKDATIHLPQPDIAEQSPRLLTSSNDGITVTREGSFAKFEWELDFGGCKTIEVYRNTTGMAENRERTGRLHPAKKEFNDRLPNSGVFYYWLKVKPVYGEAQNFGPVVVPADPDKGNIYQDSTEAFRIAVSRTSTVATIALNFPDEEYTHIKIIKNTNPDTISGVTIHKTTSKNEIIRDPLPDANSEYWYRAEVLLESGNELRVGPIKAEY